MMSIVPEEESLQSLSISPDMKDSDQKHKPFTQQQQQHHQQQQHQQQQLSYHNQQRQQEERGETFPNSRSRTSETLSAIQTFGTIAASTSSSEKASTLTSKSSSSQTSQTGFQTSQTGFQTSQTSFLAASKNSNTLPPSYQYYGSTGEIQPKSYKSGKSSHVFTTFRQKPLPRSQSYSGNNLYTNEKQLDFYDQKNEENNLNEFKWTIPPPPPEFQSGTFQNGSKTTQVLISLFCSTFVDPKKVNDVS